MFYGIGHFSRFIVPDSVRLDVRVSHTDIQAVGFQRPDNTIALVLFSKYEFSLKSRNFAS